MHDWWLTETIRQAEETAREIIRLGPDNVIIDVTGETFVVTAGNDRFYIYSIPGNEAFYQVMVHNGYRSSKQDFVTHEFRRIQ